MNTRIREVKTYIIEWVCEKDGCDGLMEHSVGAAALLVDPPKYLHTCNKCDHDEYYGEIYPKAKVEYIDEEEE